jgi:hypothetical protein
VHHLTLKNAVFFGQIKFTPPRFTSQDSQMADKQKSTAQKAIQKRTAAVRVKIFDATTPGTGEGNLQRIGAADEQAKTLATNGFPTIEFGSESDSDSDSDSSNDNTTA